MALRPTQLTFDIPQTWLNPDSHPAPDGCVCEYAANLEIWDRNRHPRDAEDSVTSMEGDHPARTKRDQPFGGSLVVSVIDRDPETLRASLKVVLQRIIEQL